MIPLLQTLTRIPHRFLAVASLTLMLVVVVGGVRSCMLSSSLETARATITALKTDTTRVRTELRQMQRAVEAQNDSIDVLRQKARRLEVDVRTAERDGRRTRLVSERDAARILATPATDTSCTVAIRRAVHYADSLSSGWD